MIILKFLGQQATMADQSSSTSLGCSFPNCWKKTELLQYNLNLALICYNFAFFFQSHLDSDVEEVVGDHLRRLRRSPSFSTSTLLRINPNLRLGTDIGIDQLQVVEPRQQVVQETLDDRWPSGLETVTDF